MSREQILHFPKIAEQTERFDDMFIYVKHACNHDSEISVEDRNIFGVAFKNKIGFLRNFWRTISENELKEQQNASTF